MTHREVSTLARPPKLLKEAPVDEDFLKLEPAREGDEVVHDYARIGHTLRTHSQLLLRRHLQARRVHDPPNGRLVRFAGIVTVRQSPKTADGTVFIVLEDEIGSVKVVV